MGFKRSQVQFLSPRPLIKPSTIVFVEGFILFATLFVAELLKKYKLQYHPFSKSNAFVFPSDKGKHPAARPQGHYTQGQKLYEEKRSARFITLTICAIPVLLCF